MKERIPQESFEDLDEPIEEGRHEIFELHLPIGKVRHSYIKRKISVQIGNEVYYDITTSNSYGGPVVFDCHQDDRWEMVDEFQRAFQAYCKENKIVSEYVSFDPSLLNVLDFVCIYQVECIGQTYDINLANNSQTYIYDFDKNDRKKFHEAKNKKKKLNIHLYVGKKVWNEEIYKEICTAVQIGIDADFFPAYRFKEHYTNSFTLNQKY